MTQRVPVIEILVVDDDPEVLNQLKDLVPGKIGDQPVAWEWSGDFDEALATLRRRRFDLLVSDIYRGREVSQKNIAHGDLRARDLVSEIRAHRFCPIVLFTDGTCPDDLIKPFVWFADKADPDFQHQLIEKLAEAIGTGLPRIARRLHDEIDRFAGSYVWNFLSTKWNEIRERHGFDEQALERVLRRRAALQIGRLDSDGEAFIERTTCDPVDYYIYPAVATDFRLGQIVRHRETREFRVVLTPHCFLTRQPGQDTPRATHVLTAGTIPASSLAGSWKWSKDTNGDLRRRTALPANVPAAPEGRYSFLPAFLDIPDLYCDLFQIDSIAYEKLIRDFESVAVLDAPYAEALQASLGRLYAAVGLPTLNVERVAHLRAAPAETSAEKPQQPRAG